MSMKKILVILLSVFAFVACSKDDYVYEFDYPTDHLDYDGQMRYFAQFIERGLPKNLPDGWYREEIHSKQGGGLRSNQFKMFVVDEEGNSLLDVNDFSTWPVPMCFSAAKEDPENYYTNMTDVSQRQLACVAQRDPNELPYFHMMAPTNDEHTNSFKLLMLGKEYEIKMTYLHMFGADGGCCYTHIFRWDINGELLYSDFESHCNVYGRGTSNQAVVTIKKDGSIRVERIWVK